MAEQDQTTDVVVQQPATDEAGQQVTEQPQPQGEKPVERMFTQHDVDKIVQRRVAKAHRRIGALEAQMQMLNGQMVRPDVSAVDQPPKREDFQDYEAYIRADAAYAARQEVARATQNMDVRLAEDRQIAQREKLIENFEKRKAEGRAKYQDFEEVTESPDVMLSGHMVEAILESDVAHDLAYHLAKNPDEAERIYSLPRNATMREIGKLEAKLASGKPAAPKKDNLPEPITPVTSGKEIGVKWDSDKASYDDFKQGLNKALYGR